MGALLTRPFTTRTARKLGISAHELRGAAYRQLFHGVHLSSEAPLNLETWVQAARLVLPADARVTGLTALRLDGLALGNDFPLWFRSSQRCRNRRPGIMVVQEPNVLLGRDTTVEAYARLARHGDLLLAVQVGDRLVHQGVASLEEVAGCGLPGSLVRRGSESPKETELRLLLVGAGLPEPRCNVRLGDLNGPVARVDLLYAEYRLILEYEGRQHLTDTNQWNHDITRFETLTGLGYRVLRVTQERLYRPVDLVHTVHRLLVEGGYRGRPPALDAGWRTTFRAAASVA